MSDKQKCSKQSLWAKSPFFGRKMFLGRITKLKITKTLNTEAILAEYIQPKPSQYSIRLTTTTQSALNCLPGKNALDGGHCHAAEAPGPGRRRSRGLGAERGALGVNSIEFQQTVQRDFQQSI